MMTARRGMQGGPPAEESWPELHEELGRLPERFREPIVLCHLEGLTQEQAAAAAGVADRDRPEPPGPRPRAAARSPGTPGAHVLGRRLHRQESGHPRMRP